MRESSTHLKRKKRKVKGERVSIISEGVMLPLSKNEIKKLVRKTLSLFKESNSRVGLVFVNDGVMRRLNWKYRKIDRATDCLAFPMREGVDGQLNPELLGDVVISVDTAKRNAKLYGANVKKEMSLYIIHGILHLLGFKDTTALERKKMLRREEDILRRL